MHAEELGTLIAFHRKQAGLSQLELAKHAGVSRYVIQDIEAGNGRTTWKKLESVLTILNVRLEAKGPLVEKWRQLTSDTDESAN